LLALALAVPLFAAAQSYPTKPVNLIVPFPPGGATDVIARMVAEKLAVKWGQPVVVTNKPGAGTLLAAEQVARAPGDGYTLYMTTASHTISANLYKKVPYDAIKDFTPVTLISTIPLVLVTTPSVPAKTLPELIAYARANRGMSFASSGNGTPPHLTMELFKARNNLDLTHIPYKGDTPMLTDLLGGQVQMAFMTLSAVLPQIKAGKLKAIAVAHAKRVEAIPAVPTVQESGMPGFLSATWFGIYGPGTLQADLTQRIYRDVAQIVAVPEFTAKLKEMGGEVDNSTPQAFQVHVDAEMKRWAEAVRLSGAQVN
jgi:tripartite-type tricarboxylate transporter receptor subunit TctC